jgi:hypothetical protein
MKQMAGAALLAITLLAFEPLFAQTPNVQEQEQLNALVREVQAQQTAIAENQTKIDAKLATLAETIREARIYSSRTGR